MTHQKGGTALDDVSVGETPPAAVGTDGTIYEMPASRATALPEKSAMVGGTRYGIAFGPGQGSYASL